MYPMTQAIDEIRQLANQATPVSSVEMLRRLISAELERLGSPQIINIISAEHRQLFETHRDQVQAFLQSADGADAFGLLVEAFQMFVRREPEAATLAEPGPVEEVDQAE